MPALVITKSHKTKQFYDDGLTSSKYENLKKSIKNGLKYEALSKQAQNVEGVEELFLILESGKALTENVASEELKSLFNTDNFNYKDVVKDLGGRKLRGVKPEPTIAQKEVAKKEVSDVMSKAIKKVSEKKQKEIKQIKQEVAKEEVSDVIRKALNRVSVERQKEIEKEVRDKLDLEESQMRETGKESQPTPRAQVPPQQQDKPRVRPSASTSSASEPDLSAQAPPAPPAPAPPAPAERKRPKESAILDPTPVTSVDLIPNERRSAEFKTAKQLRSDVEFFFESFPEMLEKEMREYIRVNKTSKKELARFHRKIMGKLQPSESVSPDQKKVGIVISADEYIKQAINKALIDAKMLSMNPADVVELSVKGADKKDDTESYGSYEVKKSKTGKLSAQKEPIYRYVPKVNEEAEREPRSSMLRVKKRETLPQTAKRQVRNNPFLQRQTNSVRLKYLY